jgi:hypothetical protein
VSVTRFSGKAVVASWRIQLGGGNPSLASELLQRFVDGTALHLDIDQPCYFRVLVREPGDTDALCDEIAAVITRHAPAARVTTRVVTAPELGEGIDAEHHGRYKAAAESLWKLLDDIDTADDAARKDDARYRATARTIAKRRSEHAVSFDGHTLVWSWDSPLPAADMAKLEVKVLQGETTDDEIAEYKRLVALHEPSPERGTAIKLEVDAQIQEASLPPEFYDGTSAAAEKDLTSEEVAGALEHKGVLKPELLELAAKDLHKRSYGPAPTFLERIAEAGAMPDYYKTERRLIELQPKKYDAADCIKVPPGGPEAIALNESGACWIDHDDVVIERQNGQSFAVKGLTNEEYRAAIADPNWKPGDPLPIADDCPECNGTGEQPGPDPFNPPCECEDAKIFAPSTKRNVSFEEFAKWQAYPAQGMAVVPTLQSAARVLLDEWKSLGADDG